MVRPTGFGTPSSTETQRELERTGESRFAPTVREGASSAPVRTGAVLSHEPAGQGVQARPRPGKISTTDYPLVAMFPMSIGNDAFDPEAYELAKRQGSSALFDAIGFSSDDGVHAFVQTLGQTDLSALTDLGAQAHLPAFVRALELRLVSISNVQALIDRIVSESPNRTVSDTDKEWIFRLCAAANIRLDSVNVGGERLAPQWLANRYWHNDPSNRDSNARYLSWCFQRSGVSLDSVFYGPPMPEGYAIVTGPSGRALRTPSKEDSRPVRWRDGKPDWPEGLPFTSDRGVPHLSYTAFDDQWRMMLDPLTGNALKNGRTAIVAQDPVRVEGNWLSMTRIQNPGWLSARRGVQTFPVYAEEARPLGEERLPEDLGDERSEKVAEYFGDETFQKMGRLADVDVLMSYIFLTHHDLYPSHGLEPNSTEQLARARVEARIHELVNSGQLASIFVANGADAETAAELAAQIVPPKVSFFDTAKGMPNTTEAIEVTKRLADATLTPYSRISWRLEQRPDSFGTLTLENAVSLEPTYVDSQYRNAALFNDCLDQIHTDFGGKVAERIDELVQQIEVAYQDRSRGPRFVGHEIKLEEAWKRLDDAANFIVEGNSGGGKTTLRNLIQKMLLAAGCVEGIADIHYEKLEPALKATDHSAVKISVAITKLDEHGELVETEKKIGYDDLAHELKNHAIGIEEFGRAAPMTERLVEDDLAAKKFVSKIMELKDKAGPVSLDGYDGTGIMLQNQGMPSRFERLLAPSPGPEQLNRAIETWSYEACGPRGLSNIEVTAQGRDWLIKKVLNAGDEGGGHYRNLRNRLNAALSDAIAQAEYGTNRIRLDASALIGRPVDLAYLSEFKKRLAAKDPPLFGLERQIDDAFKMLTAAATLKSSGKDKNLAVAFESPAGTGMSELISTFLDDLSNSGLAMGKAQRLDHTILSSVQGLTEKDADRLFNMQGGVLEVSTTGWPVQMGPTPAGERENPLETVRRRFLNLLKRGELKCHVVLTGDRNSIDRFMHDVDNPRVPFQAWITTSQITNPQQAGYATDHGHLSNAALIQYMRYYLDDLGVKLEDGMFRSAEGRMSKFFDKQKQIGGFSNAMFVESFADRAYAAQVAGLFVSDEVGATATEAVGALEAGRSTALVAQAGGALEPMQAQGQVGKGDIAAILSQLAAVYEPTFGDRFAVGWKSFSRLATRPVRRRLAQFDNYRADGTRFDELEHVRALLTDLAKLRGSGRLTDEKARDLVTDTHGSWAPQLLADFGVEDAGTMSRKVVRDTFMDIGRSLKEEREAMETITINQPKKDAQERREDRKDRSADRRATNFQTAAILVRGSGNKQPKRG